MIDLPSVYAERLRYDAELLRAKAPPSRELSLALTKMDEARMWLQQIPAEPS